MAEAVVTTGRAVFIAIDYDLCPHGTLYRHFIAFSCVRRGHCSADSAQTHELLILGRRMKKCMDLQCFVSCDLAVSLSDIVDQVTAAITQIHQLAVARRSRFITANIH